MRRVLVLGSVGFCLFTAAVVSGCRGSGARTSESAAFHGPFVGANVDPTIRPARLVPELVDDSQGYGAEASASGTGGTRAITAGLRVVSSPGGAVVAADERLPQAPSSTISLPERLGGGFLFVLGVDIWRADRWLGPAKPIYKSSQAIQAVIPGLDRVYVRGPNTTTAIDGRSGRLLDLGPWPASPYVASYAAADGWRAAAVTDLRGVVATYDAGATWRTLDLPFEAKRVVADRDSLAIGGLDSQNAKGEAWYEIRPDGSITRMTGAPRDVKEKLVPITVRPAASYYGGFRPPPSATAAPEPPKAGEEKNEKEDFEAKTFGKRPLASAIEDGWPLTDGTAVVARDGALARIRLADGAITEVARDAFPLKPARCHPVSLNRPRALGAFGFVCGEPRGTTVLYAYEPLKGRLLELKRFDKPRVVTSSGNGALAVRGPCAEDGEPTPPARPEPAKLEKTKEERDRDRDGKDKERDLKGKTATDEKPEKSASVASAISSAAPPPPPTEIHPYCVLGHDDTWREIHVRGDVGGERVVVLTDGRIVVVSPPQGIGSPARITILDKGKATTAPVAFPKLSPEVARVLRLGLWLDGFEERKPGVVGGWIEAGGIFLGIEIALDGKATPGQFIRDAGFPFVSGKYGLGWTASRRGYETVDGGMTWTSIDLPDALVPMGKVERRACGPVGCLANGWLRVGWGEVKHEAPPPVAPLTSKASSLFAPSVSLVCEPMATVPPTITAAARPAPERAASAASTSRHGPSISASVYGGSSGVLGSYNGLQELPAFFHQPPQALRDPERGLAHDVKETVDRSPGFTNLAKLYGWGPKTGDWDTQGRWQVKWLSPYNGWPDLRASLPTLPPAFIVDATRTGGGYYGGGYGGYYGSQNYQFVPGDDGSHALLVARRVQRNDNSLFELEADRAPLEVRRADGEPFGEIEGAVRVAGRWYLATPPTNQVQVYNAQPNTTTVIWQIEGAIARELVRVPRAMSEVGGAYMSGGYVSNRGTRMARRSNGRAVGLVADGQPSADRTGTNTRWVLPIDLETGALGEPELLGYVDLAGRTLEACTEETVGWVVDMSLASTTSVRMKLPTGGGVLTSTNARLRLSSDRACIERLSGSYDGSSERTAQLARPGAASRTTLPPRPGDILVSAMSSLTRYPLRCSVAK
ncbi:MAG: hypothetical protein U0270_06380 [Labilithrix sp.]